MSTAVTQLGYNRLVDVMNNYSTQDSKGVYLKMAQVLHRACMIFGMLPMVPSNQVLAHVASRESYLPTPGSRRFNEYVKPSAGRSTPLTEGIALFEDFFNVDSVLYGIQNDKAQWMADKIEQKIESFKQKIGTGIFYGSTSFDGQDILGLAARFHSTTQYPNGDTTWKYNVWDGGGTGSTLTSIWVVEFGLNKFYGTFPANLPGGMDIKNLGEQMLQDGSGGQMLAQVVNLKQMFGMMIEDERCVQRVANNQTTGNANTFDEMLLIDALERLPNRGDAPGTAIIVNRTMSAQMNKRATVAKTNAYYTQYANGDVFGARRVTAFQGVPVIVDDMILDTETQVTSAT